MLAFLISVIKSTLPLPDWPEWALDVLLVMTALLAATGGLTRSYNFDDDGEGDGYDDDSDDDVKKPKRGESAGNGTSNGVAGVGQSSEPHGDVHEMNAAFYKFRRQYMIVYSIIMLADWMQGTHMYTLYMSYGVNVSALFLTGFLSGGIFAPFLGSFVDKFGRKRSCIVYCVLEIMINVMEGYQNFAVLMAGRIMGGVSTNLLFSAFESWMTTQHRHLGFPEEWLSRTYSQCSVVNGTTAILAGIVAQVLEDLMGHIGPFHGAVFLTTLALLLVARWDENYGEESAGEHNQSGTLYHQFVEGWKTTVQDSNVWRIGLTQALSEGAMYTFVFMWVPTLLSLNPPGGVPTGCVFSALMMSITMGGFVFPVLQYVVKNYVMPTMNGLLLSNGAGVVVVSKKVDSDDDRTSEVCASLVYLLASVSMAIPVMCLSTIVTDHDYCQEMILGSFLVVEFCVGLFMPVSGTLRSKYVPDALQGAILNIFRLPLNAIVVSGTYATNVLEPSVVFQLVSTCFFAAAVLQSTMIFSPSSSKTPATKCQSPAAAAATTTSHKKVD